MPAAKYLIAAFLLLTPFIVRCDDVFLINGCVYRNVRVVDSTKTVLRIDFNGRNLSIRRSMVDHIKKREIDTTRKAVYEMYSKMMSESFKTQNWAEEEAASVRMLIDSADTKLKKPVPDTSTRYHADMELPFTSAANASLALRMDAPLGVGLEFNLRLGHISGMIAFCQGDSWSCNGISSIYAGVSLNLFSCPSKWDAYVSYVSGTTFLHMEGSAERCNMIAGGVRIYLNRSFIIRLETGYLSTHCREDRLSEKKYFKELLHFGLALELVM